MILFKNLPPSPHWQGSWWVFPTSPSFFERFFHHMGVSLNGGVFPPNLHFNRDFHYKPSILGYPYFWKHPYFWGLQTLLFSMGHWGYKGGREKGFSDHFAKAKKSWVQYAPHDVCEDDGLWTLWCRFRCFCSKVDIVQLGHGAGHPFLWAMTMVMSEKWSEPRKKKQKLRLSSILVVQQGSL